MNKELTKPITQRIVLSYVSSVFDRIGLVARYTVRVRLLRKDIWRISGQQWDETLSGEIQEKFIERHTLLPTLGRLKTSRCFFDIPVDQVELHIIGDSSQDVFCSVAYFARLRSLRKSKKVHRVAYSFTNTWSTQNFSLFLRHPG